MSVSASGFSLTALLLPLLTSGAAWAIAVWALRQDGTWTSLIRRLQSEAAESEGRSRRRHLSAKHMRDRGVTAYLIAVIAGSMLANARPVLAHEIQWSKGAARTQGYGQCAKGPCQRRTSFESSVPHRHLGKGKCAGLGAGGYSLNRVFAC
ncbi:hypothetical protein [Hyphomicrobium sp.]|uniref:hypothetical protein n=1 Tax=Hyphomicrobium sp. TaxID=82 RepID=UPI002E375747|nr:hypothetical protein [Hyphomicrobium sp.]HEX2842681.1 hypothetical protein [Hyphomicrobium sp.]